MATGGSISAAFTLVTSVSATLFMGVWVVIVVSYLVYLRKRPQLHAESHFKSPGGALARGSSWRSWAPWVSSWRCGTTLAPASSIP